MSKRDNWDQRYASRDLVWSAGPNLKFSEEIAELTPGSALDVACGEGRNAIWLAENGWDVTGIDFSNVGIDKSTQIAVRKAVNVNWIVADICEYALPTNTFDLVIVLYVHTSRQERDIWLPSVIQSVAPGGTFLYIGHDPENIGKGTGGPQDPALLPSAEVLEGHLSGFTMQKAGVIERSVSADAGHGGPVADTALDTLVKARKLNN